MPKIRGFQVDVGTSDLNDNAIIVKLDSNNLSPVELSKISTGLFTGGEISFGTLTGSPGTTTKISISAGAGIVVDNYTDPQNPTYQLVSWPAFTDVEVVNIATNPRTFIAISAAGSPSPAVVQKTIHYTYAEHRDVIMLGTVGHVNNANVVAVRNDPIAAFDVNARLGDLARAIGAFNIDGNIYGSNGVNLNIDKSIGESYRIGNNFHNNKASPDVTTDVLETATLWNYSYRDGIGGYTLTGKTNLVVPGNYDDGDGTLGIVGTQSWTVQQILHFPGGAGTRIEYGQTVYGTDTDAIASIPDINHSSNPGFAEGILRSYLVVRGGATDLSDTADATFIEAARFTGTGGSTVISFPGIDDQSTTTQITITDTEVTFAARIDAITVTETQLTASPVATYTADFLNGNVFELTLGGNTTITFSNVPVSTNMLTATFILIQDATGNRVPTFSAGSPNNVLWDNGTVPTWETAAGNEDVVRMFTYDGGITWRANLIGKNYA